jgi:hypothetical protein
MSVYADLPEAYRGCWFDDLDQWILAYPGLARGEMILKKKKTYKPVRPVIRFVIWPSEYWLSQGLPRAMI